VSAGAYVLAFGLQGDRETWTPYLVHEGARAFRWAVNEPGGIRTYAEPIVDVVVGAQRFRLAIPHEHDALVMNRLALVAGFVSLLTWAFDRTNEKGYGSGMTMTKIERLRAAAETASTRARYALALLDPGEDREAVIRAEHEDAIRALLVAAQDLARGLGDRPETRRTIADALVAADGERCS